MTLAQSIFFVLYEDGSNSSPNYRLPDIERKDKVKGILLKSSSGSKAVIMRSDSREQFFQLFQNEIVVGLGDFVVANYVGKVINKKGDCVYIIHDCKQDTFVTNVGNVFTLIRNGPINLDMMGITGLEKRD